MSASNYPRSLDTDVNLNRVISTSALVPALINNHTDALEAMQPTAGICDDGTAYGVPGTFNRGLTDHVGLMTTAGPNGRYPFLPRSAASWYGTDNGTPGAWTIPAGWSVSYSPPKGPVKILVPTDATVRWAHAAIVPSAIYEVVARVRFWDAFGSLGFGVGLGTDAAGSDFCGVSFSANNLQSNFPGGGTAVALPPDYMTNGGDWFLVRVRLDGTDLSVWCSRDGLVWDMVEFHACTVVPTKVLLFTFGGAGQQSGAAVGLDFVSNGSAAPQGQA